MKRKEYYIRKQTNAGPNQGKWRVHSPNGVSVSPACDRRAQAVLICAAFNLASQHPVFGERFPYESNFRIRWDYDDKGEKTVCTNDGKSLAPKEGES
jgi:hypothetical protein